MLKSLVAVLLFAPAVAQPQQAVATRPSASITASAAASTDRPSGVATSRSSAARARLARSVTRPPRKKAGSI